MLFDLYQRSATSYKISLASYHERIQLGTQPSTKVLDLFSVDAQEKILTTSCVFYISLIIFLYQYMQSKKLPFKVKKLMMLYNILNVLISIYVAWGIIWLKFFKGDSINPFRRGVLVCNNLDTSADGLQMAHLFTVFYLQKFLEFLDTVFFLLRKSFRQVTFLHLFHHSSITVIVGTVLPFSFSDDMFLPILMNSITHSLLYLHYIVTGLGMHAWWSKYLTSVQIGQFAVILIQSCAALHIGPDCGSPDFVKILLVVYMGSMLFLFGIFFTQKYILKIDAADMCGVIKSIDTNGNGIASCWHGNVKLDENGDGNVYLPNSFHISPDHKMYCYQLTPVGSPMPSLYVSKCVAPTLGGYRFSISGGSKNCWVSWQVTSVQIDDRVPH